MPRAMQAPWYVKVEQYGEPPMYTKALVLSDRDAVPINVMHSDGGIGPRYRVFLLDLPWRMCESCPYPHVASGGQELLSTDSLRDAERVYEGADVMMRGQITSPAIVHEIHVVGGKRV